jgi:hypothetical protein
VRRIVLEAGRVQRVEHHGLGGTKIFGTAGQHQRQTPEFDRFIGIAHTLAAAGAGTGGRDQAAGEIEENADIRRRGVRHHAHVRVGVEAFGHGIQQHVAECLDLVSAAGGRTTGHAHTAVTNDRIAQQARVAQRLFCGADSESRHPAHAAQLLARPVRGHREIIDGAGQTRA